MRRFFEKLTLLYIASIEQENNFDDDFAEYVRTFLMSDLRNKYLMNNFQGCQQYSLMTNYIHG